MGWEREKKKDKVRNCFSLSPAPEVWRIWGESAVSRSDRIMRCALKKNKFLILREIEGVLKRKEQSWRERKRMTDGALWHCVKVGSPMKCGRGGLEAICVGPRRACAVLTVNSSLQH